MRLKYIIIGLMSLILVLSTTLLIINFSILKFNALILGLILLVCIAAIVIFFYYDKLTNIRMNKYIDEYNSLIKQKDLYHNELDELSNKSSTQDTEKSDKVMIESLLSESQYIHSSVVVVTKLLQCVVDQSQIDTDKIIEKLNNISEYTVKLFNENMSTLKSAIGMEQINDSTKSFLHLEESSKRIKNVNDVLDNLISMSQSEEQNLIEVESKIEEITNFTQKIAQIAEFTNVLSINASIEASKSGGAAKGFTIIAREIKKLASEAKKSVSTIQNLANDAVLSVHSLKNDYQSTISKIATHVHESKHEIDDIFNIITTSYKQIADSVLRISDYSNQYKTNIEDMIFKYLQNQDIISQQISHVQQFIKTADMKLYYIDKNIDNSNYHIDYKQIQQNIIDDIFDTLTMDLERDCLESVATDIFGIDSSIFEKYYPKNIKINNKATEILGKDMADQSVTLF